MLDGDQMSNHLQRLGVLLVGIGPCVRSDSGSSRFSLARGALPIQLGGVRDRPGPHPANRLAHQIQSARSAFRGIM